MRRLALGLAVMSLAGCAKTPAGTVVADWNYAATEPEPSRAPVSMSPPKIVTSDAEWPVDKGPPVKLRFETEIGDYRGADDVHWNWPRHIRITIAEPMTAKLPAVDCMPGPPGNRVENGKLVRPVGKDGVTPIGLVACFFSTATGTAYVFDVNGDGVVTRSVPKH